MRTSFVALYRAALAAVLCLSVSLFSSCESEPDSSTTIQVRSPGSDDELGLTQGDTLMVEPAEIEALVVILDGLWSDEGRRSIAVDRVLDSPAYVRASQGGDPHWITRGSVLDSSGEVLWSQHVNSLFQLLEFLQVVLDGQSTVNFTAQLVYQLVVGQYPDLIQFPVKVPTSIPGGQTYVLELREPNGSWIELGRFSIGGLHAQAVAPSVDVEVTDLSRTGPDSDRLTIAILGDGYTEAERSRFEADAQAVADRILTTTPLREHSDLLNIKAVWAPSNESGAGYDCNHSTAPPGCQQAFRDTVFETVFVIPAISDQFGLPMDDVSDRVAMPLKLGKIFEAGALAQYDEIVLISNSQKRSGFAGLYVALVTNFDNRQTFPDVAVHELGHTLGLLGDEYNVPGDSCYFNEPTIPLPANISDLVDGQVRWSDWIEEDTPMPTPPGMFSQFPVGAYMGAYNCNDLVRPAHRCKMNLSTDDFCHVCSEQMVRRMYSYVEPLAAQENIALRIARNTVEFVPPLRSGFQRYTVEWTLDGQPLDEGAVLRLDAAELAHFPRGQWLTLEGLVRNSTDFLRTPDSSLESHFRWEIRLQD